MNNRQMYTFDFEEERFLSYEETSEKIKAQLEVLSKDPDAYQETMVHLNPYQYKKLKKLLER